MPELETSCLIKSLEPVAVLDWEMAGLAPVEVDLGWMIFMHKFFQVIAEALEFPGMPKFMTSRDVTSNSPTLQELFPRILIGLKFMLLPDTP